MASGEKVPIVVFAKFTTLAGSQVFLTTPLDTLGWTDFEISWWRGDVVGGGTFYYGANESPDMVAWDAVGPQDEVLPMPDKPKTTTVTPTQRYLRWYARIDSAAGASCTIYAIGYAHRTEE